jgi:hypothetical protein
MSSHMNIEQEERKVTAFLRQAGYGDAVIEIGLDFARRQGWANADEAGQLALSFILLSDIQREAGERVAWEPVDWTAIES